jgi:hypothetical protein
MAHVVNIGKVPLFAIVCQGELNGNTKLQFLTIDLVKTLLDHNTRMPPDTPIEGM